MIMLYSLDAVECQERRRMHMIPPPHIQDCILPSLSGIISQTDAILTRSLAPPSLFG